MVGDSEALRRLAVRLTLKFAGERVSEDAFEEIVSGVAVESDDHTSKPA